MEQMFVYGPDRGLVRQLRVKLLQPQVFMNLLIYMNHHKSGLLTPGFPSLSFID